MASTRAPARPRAPGMVGLCELSFRGRRDMVSVPAPVHAPADRPGRVPVFRLALGPAGPRERSSPQRRDTV